MGLTMLVSHVDDGRAYSMGSHGLLISDFNANRGSIGVYGSE